MRRLNTFRTATAFALCCTLMQPAMYAEAAGTSAGHRLSQDDKVLHALNRFTFGPRPGDEARVKAEGLDKWFEEQLNASNIPDGAFEERMLQFPALKLDPQAMARKFPFNAAIKRAAFKDAAKGKERPGANYAPQIPKEPVARAIWETQIARERIIYSEKGEKGAKGEKAADGSMKPDAAMPGGDMAAQNGSMAAAAQKGPGGAELRGDERIPRMGRDEVQAIVALEPQARFQKILSMKPEERLSLLRSSRLAVGGSAYLGAGAEVGLLAGFTPEEREAVMAMYSSPRVIGSEVMESRLLRDIYSERQLEAVMTDFWLNHFNVYIQKSQYMAFALPEYERDVIRRNALGNFETLLVATAKSPAMQMYLDNFLSIGPDSKAGKRGALYGAKNTGLNENYARELMELHTLGVNGGYSQHDVTEVAKVFTGWGIDRYGQRGSEFDFNDQRHEPGSKMVLGHEIRESGEAEGMQVLHMLATSPATAQFISKKLAVRFVSDNPPQSLVNHMAKTFLDSKGDIKAVLRTMFHDQEFWAPEAYRAKLKTPLEYVISAARVSSADVHSALPLAQSLKTLGMPVYGAQPPTGYYWTEETWLSSAALINRMNFSLLLSTNRLPGTDIDWAHVLTQKAGVRPVGFEVTAGVNPMQAEKERTLEHVVLGFPASDKTRKTVLSEQAEEFAKQAAREFKLGNAGENAGDGNGEGMMAPPRMNGKGGFRERPQAATGAAAAFFQQRRTPTDPQAANMAGLLLGSPEFQRR